MSTWRHLVKFLFGAKSNGGSHSPLSKTWEYMVGGMRFNMNGLDDLYVAPQWSSKKLLHCYRVIVATEDWAWTGCKNVWTSRIECGSLNPLSHLPHASHWWKEGNPHWALLKKIMLVQNERPPYLLDVLKIYFKIIWPHLISSISLIIWLMQSYILSIAYQLYA